MDTSAGAEAAIACSSRMIPRLPENINGGVKISKVNFVINRVNKPLPGYQTVGRMDAISTGIHSVTNLDF
jgi:hypothetical protein